jgi:hypothetical protein
VANLQAVIRPFCVPGGVTRPGPRRRYAGVISDVTPRDGMFHVRGTGACAQGSRLRAAGVCLQARYLTQFHARSCRSSTTTGRRATPPSGPATATGARSRPRASSARSCRPRWCRAAPPARPRPAPARAASRARARAAARRARGAGPQRRGGPAASRSRAARPSGRGRRRRKAWRPAGPAGRGPLPRRPPLRSPPRRVRSCRRHCGRRAPRWAARSWWRRRRPGRRRADVSPHTCVRSRSGPGTRHQGGRTLCTCGLAMACRGPRLLWP